MKKRFGIIGSSGGSALIAAIDCLKKTGYELEPIIVVDRKCGLEDWANEQHYKVFFIPYNSPENFSEEALRAFENEGCEDVLLFYTRRVAVPLINTLRVWNIHPALLPAFKGLNAVKQALSARVSLFGATLHRVDAGLDTGPIIAQVAAPLLPKVSEERAQRLSYIQKVWLTLIWFEYIFFSNNKIEFPYNSLFPGLSLSSGDLLSVKLKEIFLEWLQQLEPNLVETGL